MNEAMSTQPLNIKQSLMGKPDQFKLKQNASMILDLLCFSYKTADFATFTSEVCKLIRNEEKWEKIEKKSYS